MLLEKNTQSVPIGCSAPFASSWARVCQWIFPSEKTI